MIEKGKISMRQFTILVFMYTLGTSVISLPSISTTFAHENGWIAVLMASIIGMLLVFMYIIISKLDEKKNLFELAEWIFGKWIGKAISALILLFILFLTAGNLRQIGDFLSTQIMTETPIQVLMVMFLLTALFAVKLGLEVTARTCEVFFPYAFFALLALLVMVTPTVDITKIQPILQKNMVGTFEAIVPSLGTPFLELFIFIAILPYVKKPKSARKGYLIGVGLGSFFLVAITFMCLTVLGADFTARNLFPTYVLGKTISLVQFLERIEIIVAIAWFFTIYFKIVLNFYVLSLGMSHFFQLKKTHTLSVPLAFFIIVLATINSPNIIYYLDFILYYWAPFAAVFGILIPVLVLIVGKIKVRKKDNITKTE
ncbi:spore germination protein KB [Salirhabdus euzebyi]|uniref:Spore germination protein KB n=1 Tax=Salirhabdus euzebyi TaxID=394506 RepID=A0A841Q3Z1_9BACI|nr:endospore germination permease [Salirhabdus euzebyi]MBB6453107.1 spore germination protein KB [Salirhabdus euzebyi]